MKKSVFSSYLQAIGFSAFSLIAAIVSAQAQSPQSTSKPVDVIVHPVQVQHLQTRIEALGTLRANESIRLTSNVTKTVTRLNFEDGQRVKKGDVLVEMTSGEEQALLDEARFNTDEAKKQLDRVRSLVARNAAAESLLDQRLREYESARARYAAVESRLNDLHLVAPFSGVVGLRNISVGALVTPGNLITTLNDDSKMKLDFTVPAVFLQNLDVGLPIRAFSHDLNNKVFEGKILSIDNQIDPVTRAITVRALLPNEGRELTQGMLMMVELYTNQRDALVVPESALVPFGNNNFVFVTRQDGPAFTVDRREIQIGQRLQGYVEVLNGISDGDKVVIHGLQKIRSGQSVNVIAEKTDRESLAELLSSKKS